LLPRSPTDPNAGCYRGRYGDWRGCCRGHRPADPNPHAIPNPDGYLNEHADPKPNPDTYTNHYTNGNA
jgi:hypothetical protein